MNAVSTLLVLFAISAPPEPKPADIDYEARLNDILAKGITPEKNANVLIWKALGPTPEGGKPLPAEFFKRLRIPQPPEKGEYFIGIYDYARKLLKLEPNAVISTHQKEVAEIRDQEDQAYRRPWRERDYPRIAEWLKLNEKPLALIIEATKRPQYYSPVIAIRKEGKRGSLIGHLMPAVQKCREVATALNSRAMLRIGEGKTNEAWQDLLAAHRLSRLIARGGTNLDAVVGFAIGMFTTRTTLTYLDTAKLSPKQLRDCLSDLQTLPAWPSLADNIDVGERYLFLDTIHIISEGGDPSGGTDIVPEEERPVLKAIHWELIRSDAKHWHDRTAKAMRIKDRAERDRALGDIGSALEADVREATKRKREFEKTNLGDAGQIVAKHKGMILIGLNAALIGKTLGSFDRAEQIERNLQVAFALAAYRADRGRYPDKLDELAPKYIAAVPNDLFAGKSLIYRPSGKDYLFYSIGENKQDEEGRSFDDDPKGDDLIVRMPPESKKK
jgi:hypothetical protein